MKNKLYLVVILIFAVSLFKANPSYGNIGDNSYIDINITKPLVSKQSINFENIGGFSIYYRENKFTPIFEIEESSIKAVLNDSGDIELIDLLGSVLFIIPKDNEYLLHGNGFDNNTIKIEKDRYRGFLYLDNINGNIRVVNHIDIEEYLYGLVPREMPSSFPEEALKAQAVAGRTYALHTKNSGKHTKDGYDLCATTHCQVYGGFDGEKPSTNKSVDDTRGMIATYNGNTIDAQYHSSSSGYTNDSLDVWGGDYPYLKSVKDEYSIGAPSNIWNISVDISTLNNKLSASGINIGNLQDVEISKVSENGNVNTLMLRGSLGIKEIKASTFRSMIGNTDVKSTNFTIKKEGTLAPVEQLKPLENLDNNTIKSKHVYVMDGSKSIASLDIKRSTIMDKNGKTKMSASSNRAMTMNRIEDLNIEIDTLISTPILDSSSTNYNSKIIIDGKGYGHGVGMSQYGAKKMAELGFTFQDILKHYYTGIDIF